MFHGRGEILLYCRREADGYRSRSESEKFKMYLPVLETLVQQAAMVVPEAVRVSQELFCVVVVVVVDGVDG